MDFYIDIMVAENDITKNDIYQLISRIVELRGFKIVVGWLNDYIVC